MQIAKQSADSFWITRAIFLLTSDNETFFKVKVAFLKTAFFQHQFAKFLKHLGYQHTFRPYIIVSDLECLQHRLLSFTGLALKFLNDSQVQ